MGVARVASRVLAGWSSSSFSHLELALRGGFFIFGLRVEFLCALYPLLARFYPLLRLPPPFSSTPPRSGTREVGGRYEKCPECPFYAFAGLDKGTRVGW